MMAESLPTLSEQSVLLSSWSSSGSALWIPGQACSSSLLWSVQAEKNHISLITAEQHLQTLFWCRWCLLSSWTTVYPHVFRQGQILVLTDASAAPAKSNSVNQMSERRFVLERPGFEPAAVFISADVLHSAGCTPSRVVIAVYVPLIQSSSRSLITVSWLTVFRRFPKAKAEC